MMDRWLALLCLGIVICHLRVTVRALSTVAEARFGNLTRVWPFLSPYLKPWCTLGGQKVLLFLLLSWWGN